MKINFAVNVTFHFLEKSKVYIMYYKPNVKLIHKYILRKE